MPKHIVRLLLLMATAGVVMLGARFYFLDKSFGVYGHYRADAVAEIAADTPIYQGAAYCQSCHRERFDQWSAGIHKVVNCETCHGAAGKHPKIKPPVASDMRAHNLMASSRYDKFDLSVPADAVKLCTLCHEKMPGRPAIQRQIEVNAHAGGQACTVCHNAHSPKIAVAAVSKKAQPGAVAAGKQQAGRCAACHGADGVSGNSAWPSLAGLQETYLVTALKAYRSGVRQDPMMAGLVKGLSDAEIGQLAAYYAGLKCK